MATIEGRVLRAAPYVVLGYTNFVFDIRVERASDGIPCDEVVRVSIHSSAWMGRSSLANLAVTQRGDHVKLAGKVNVEPCEGFETFIEVNKVQTFEVRCAE
jgi:hypothetical protein